MDQNIIILVLALQDLVIKYFHFLVLHMIFVFMLLFRKPFTDNFILLLLKGAEVDAREGSGDSALMIASQNGYIEVVRLLLEAGEEI